jgi:glycosyltransferase involved in cell wall biosynthesis
MSKLILYAPNIHTGGGKTLLISLLIALEGKNCLLILDERLDFPRLKNNILFRARPTFNSRFKAETVLKDNTRKGDIILCFHSLPPLFKSQAKVLVYFHNKHMIGSIKLMLKEGPKTIFRLTIERMLARVFYQNVDQYLVQSQSMKRSLEFYYSKKMSPVDVHPFIDIPDKLFHIKTQSNKEFEFIYISVGLKHKNHINLLKAWAYLAENGIFPLLTLTLPKDNNVSNNSKTLSEMNRLVEKYQLQIENLGWVDPNEVLRIYSSSRALIFPSLMESFGLPLIEAKKIGLPIIASELDYVRDVCDPDESFDPTSYISIAKAVMRFLKLEAKGNSIQNSKEFLDSIYNDIEK